MNYFLHFHTVFLYGLSLVIIYLFFENWRSLYNFFQKFPKKAFFLSFLIFCIAFFIREFLISHMHHVYYDEFYYINIASNMYRHNIFASTLSGNILNPEILGKPIRPGGYPFILNLVFRMFGNSSEVVFQTNIFLGALSVVIIFWIGYLISNNISIGLWSAFIFTFLPSHLKYSGSGVSDISSLFFILLSILIVLIALKTRKESLFYLVLLLNIFSCYIRPGNVALYFLLVILLIVAHKKRYFSGKNLVLLLLISILLLVPLILQISEMINIEQANTGGLFISVNNLANNFLPNLQYLFDLRFHSFIGTIFFLIGSVFLFFKRRKIWYLLTGWFLFFYLMYTSYFRGKFSILFTADSDRHFFLSAVSFSILAGYGIYFLLTKVKSKKPLLIFLISTSIILNSFCATENIIDFTLDRDVYRESIFVKEAENELLKDLYVLCYEPAYIVSIIGRKTIQFDIFGSMNSPPQELILFKGFWWHERGKFSNYYEGVLEKLYNFEAITEKQIGDNKYGFYLLTRK